ncbi:MAG: hypothetical protein DRP61_02150 [Candidatus Omnitrophota bacterium]|nr:MAG: hypothetical protein DRP61_02150 [Candidatus Omnitrophota bacterium]RKY43101.1 MAG: hypothetical protein DRP80_06020 [Candidatus Omnitrophota bacterium]
MKAKLTISLRQLLSLFPSKNSSILIFILWSLIFLSFLGVYLSLGVRQKISLVKRLTFRDNLLFIAEAGVKKAILELAKDSGFPDFLKENWSNNPAVFQKIKVGLGGFNVFYQTPEGERYGLIDEERKININKADFLVLKRLLEIVGGLEETEAQELSASIVDWRDKDSFLSIPVGSAEDRYYQNLRKPYDCKDSDFEVIEELGLVKGMNKDIFEKIKDFITVYGAGSVNINTAPRQVLLSLGLREELIDKIISFRRGDDDIEGNSDDNFFDIPSNIPAKLSQFTPLSSEEVAQLSNLAAKGVFTTSSYYFRVRSQAYIEGTNLKKEVVCVVDRKGKILSWREL